MSEIANNEGASETEKPVQNDVKFPPFPEPTDSDFDEDIPEEERTYYKNKFKDLNDVKNFRLHCTSCDRHLGCSARNERMRSHPMLRTLVCHSCHTFYNSGEFEKGDDGSELYCRWCGQGGQVYCCSDCPHVFCAKCIKRNLGLPKIKEIENADDWKCFKCNPESLMDLRAICWAVLRYCDLKNKITYLTEDAELKAALQKECAIDPSECCKHKTNKRNQRINDSLTKKKDIKKETDDSLTKKKDNKKETDDSLTKKKDIKKETDAKHTANIISKMPATIQVKKFASVNLDESSKPEKKAQKRPASPKLKTLLVKNPISISPFTPKIMTAVTSVPPPLAKKIRLPNTMNTPIRYPNQNKSMATYTRIRPKVTPQLPIPIANNCFNGYSPNVFQCHNPISDNINLSLESLTQGLDMAAVAALSNNNSQNDDVVCTPDFPLEPLCEVTEDNDDDVECITPGPVAAPKVVNPPPLVPRIAPNICDVSSENIIQMTENDVTVNESTGGLKFRVDPQTLSSNKMYRLPDGRIFAINSNPNMPGGYSATIVAVTEANKGVPKGATFAAKLSSVSTSTPTPKSNNNRNQVTRFINTKSSTPKLNVKARKASETSTRECDLNVPVEWYRYNLIDAVDALEYSLSRLQKMKKDATSVFLRTRSVNEMRSLHRTLERLLNTSSCRFNEIRENLNKGLKKYILRKSGVGGGGSSEEDDDVEILPDLDDDPIFIDENSVESNMNGSENQEVDLTGPGSSEFNDSGENRNDIFSKGPSLSMLEDNESGHMLNIRSIRKIGKNVNESDNKINGVQSTRSLKCKSVHEINSLTEEFPNNQNTKSKTVDDNGILADKIALDDTNDKMQISDDSGDKLQDAEEKMQDSGNKLQNSDDKLQSLDKTCSLQVSSDKTHDEGVKMDVSDRTGHTPYSDVKTKNLEDNLKDGEMRDSDVKIKQDPENIVQGTVDKTQNSDDKTQNSDDKTQDTHDKIQGKDDKIQEIRVDTDNKMQDTGNKMQDTDNKMQDTSDKMQDTVDKMQDIEDKMQDTDDKMQDIEDKMQDTDDKMQDIQDKMQDSEMSEEMIETLLKDDNSQDSATTNPEVPKALSVT